MRAYRLLELPGAVVLMIAAQLFGWAPAAMAKSEPTAEIGTLLGSYLAGRMAQSQHDSRAAAEFFGQALVREPENEALAQQAFLMEATEGNWPRAIPLAKRLMSGTSQNRIARLVMGADEFKGGHYAEAEELFKDSSGVPVGELTSVLARAWIKSAQNETDAALAMLDGKAQAEGIQAYLRYHAALIADVGGRRAEARANYERLFKQDPRTPRTALAYIRHAANSGDFKLARAIMKEHIDKSASGEGHPLVLGLRDAINSETKLDMLVQKPVEGLAEVFYGLGEALAGDGGIGDGAVYLQIAIHLQPDFPFALAALANVYETSRRYEDAIATYDRIPASTAMQGSIDIRKAINLNLLERVDDAKALLDKLAAGNPHDIKPLDALGSIMRARKRYDEAIDYYSRAIALIPKPEKRDWTFWYSRGTCYERVKKWPQAEADLQRALQLNPDQPLVLNYLGYSWVDQNRNLKQGMSLIEKAVSLKPDDGYIVDSLGWAHFKQSNYKDAVRYLERAVELRPEDPVLNDHLGDALWRAGRTREARFQWYQALTLKPEPEDAERIKKKLDVGLPDLSTRAPAKRSKEAARPSQLRKRVEGRDGQQSIFPQ